MNGVTSALIDPNPTSSPKKKTMLGLEELVFFVDDSANVFDAQAAVPLMPLPLVKYATEANAANAHTSTVTATFFRTVLGALAACSPSSGLASSASILHQL